MSEFEFGVSLPLDSDGFLRRECPTCEREFKGLHSEAGAEGGDETEASDAETSAEEPEPGGYFCPYCAVQAPSDSWWTQPQLELIQAIGAREVMGPLLERVKRSAGEIGRSSGGLIEARVEGDVPAEPAPVQEDQDMRRIEFSCHPAEPVKVLDDWDEPVHCPMCGKPA